MKTYGSFAIMVLFSLSCTAQQVYRAGLLPQINTNFSLKNGWKLNTKLENRIIILEGSKSNFSTGRSRLERTDLEIVINKRTGARGAVGAGYLVRLEDGKLIHRFIQQYSFVHQLNGIRLAHRFRTDQTLERKEATVYRGRYRIGMEKPLNGLAIDPKEFYIKITNEYLGFMQDGRFDLDIRGLAVAGYNFSDKSKLETGIDYRAEELLSVSSQHLFWWNIAWYINL